MWESIFELGKDAINPLLIVHVVYKRFAKDAAHDQKVRRIKVESSVHATVWTHKGSFKCETIHKLELLPHYLTRRGLFALLHSEGTVLETEHVDVLAEEPTHPNIAVRDSH